MVRIRTEHCIDHECSVVDGHRKNPNAEVNAIYSWTRCSKRVYVVNSFSLSQLRLAAPGWCKRVVYTNQYRIDEYAEYLYREKEVN